MTQMNQRCNINKHEPEQWLVKCNNYLKKEIIIFTKENLNSINNRNKSVHWANIVKIS